MDRLGIEMLSVFGMPPIEYVHLTGDLGCRYITVGMIGFAPVKVRDRLLPCVESARSLLDQARENQ
jgi:hypothetical protein